MSPGRLVPVVLGASLVAAALVALSSHDREAGSASPGVSAPAGGGESADLAAPRRLEQRPGARREAPPAEAPQATGRPTYPLLKPRLHDPDPGRIFTLPAAAIRGRLRAESATWPDIDALLAGGVTLDLVTAGHEMPPKERIEKQASLARETDGSGEDVITFSFGKVPKGEYVLTVSSLGHHRWWPAHLNVTAPDETIEIWRLDRVATIALAFRVLDDQTGAEIPRFRPYAIRQVVSAEDGVFFHAGPLDLRGFPADGELEWSLSADGYAPAFGTEDDFLQEEDGRFVAEVRLRRGWGTRFVVIGRDPAMRPLAEAMVVLDGKSIGETDRLGRLDVWAREQPQELNILWADWKVQTGRIQSVAETAFRGHVSVVVMDPKSLW